jgi:hypothetical protein
LAKRKGININSKGASYEREVCHWLAENLNVHTKRLLGQARDSGADIETEHFLIEAKRRENIDLYEWWSQVMRAKKEHPNKDIIPVVAFRQNNKQTEWLIPADLLPNVDRGYLRVSSLVFKKFAKGVMHGIS